MENQQHIVSSDPVHVSRESAEIAIINSIAVQARVSFEFAKYKIVMIDYIARCNCEESITAVRGVSVINNRPYAVIRRYCKHCGTVNGINSEPSVEEIFDINTKNKY